MIRSVLPPASSLHTGLFLLLAGLPAVSGAAIIAYNNDGDFNATLGGTPVYAENFASLTTGTHAVPLAFNTGNPALSFSVDASSSAFSDTGVWRNLNPTPYGSWISTDREPSTLTFVFGSGGVSGVSGNFFITNVSENYVAGTLNISVNGGAPITITSVASGDQPFMGFRATGGETITSLSITPVIPPAPATNYYPTTANFTIAAIPEPASGFLGLVGLGLLMRRKRK